MKSCFLCDHENPPHVRRWYGLRENTCSKCMKHYREQNLFVHRADDGSMSLAPRPDATKCKIIGFGRREDGTRNYYTPELVPIDVVDSPEQLRAGSPHPPKASILGHINISDSEDEGFDSDDTFGTHSSTGGIQRSLVSPTNSGAASSDARPSDGESMAETVKSRSLMGSLRSYEVNLGLLHHQFLRKGKKIDDLHKNIKASDTSHKAEVNELSAEMRRPSEMLALRRKKSDGLKEEIANKNAEISNLREFVNRVEHFLHARRCESRRFAEFMEKFVESIEEFRTEWLKIKQQ